MLSVSISADGKYIAAGSVDDKVYKFSTVWDLWAPGLIFGSSGHLYDDNSPYDNAINIDITDEFIAGIPEFSNIMMPIVSVLAIVGFNYRRRKINLGE